MIIGSVFGIALFVFLGILFTMGKGSILIAGFNTMPKSEKEKYDTLALCKFMGKMMFLLAFSQVFWLFSNWLAIQAVLYVGHILFFGTIVFILIYANTGGRFKK